MKKTYVITGSTSGIGKAVTERLCSENIVFAGNRNEKYIDELKKLGTIPFYIDMENPDTIEKAAEYIKSKTEKIDTIINVAGCVIAGAMEKISISEIRKQFEVNTFSHLDFTQRLIPLLKSGKIINVSSMASFGIFPFVAPYCASKRALDILFNGMTLESGIKVVSIKPGVIATPLWDKSVEINKKTIENCQGFEKEMNYMIYNAHRNGQKGLNVQKVVNVILKAYSLTNPKPSYVVGNDAIFAQIVSKLPFDMQNKLIKLGLKFKINSTK